jgi:hypothetical protein
MLAAVSRPLLRKLSRRPSGLQAMSRSRGEAAGSGEG